MKPVFVGLLAGAVGVALLLLYLSRVEQDAAGGRKVQLLVASSLIERGKPITDEVLGVREVPQAYVDDRAIRASERAKVLNLKVTTNIPVQQTLMWSDLIAPTDEQRDLSSLVQPGNRAMPIRLQYNDVLPLIRPGDFVDLILVSSETKDTSVLLQRVLVLAAGLETSNDHASDRRSASSRATILTVSVTLLESQLLALAMERGKLSVVVRNPDDQRIVETPPDLPANSLNDAPKRQSMQSTNRRGPVSPVRLEADRR